MLISDMLGQLHSEINSKYGESLPELNLDGSIVRFGKKDHCWATGKSWDFKGTEYAQVSYGSWKMGDQSTIKSWAASEENKGFKTAYKKHMEETNARLAAEKIKKHLDCQKKWTPIFDNGTVKVHEYLKFKSIKKHFNTKLDSNGVLLIPAYDVNKKLMGVQRIYKNPETNEFMKKFSFGIKIKGSICPLMSFDDSEFCYIAEGFATCATIQENFPKVPVICVFNANNISPAIETIRQINPNIKIVIAADNDQVSKTGQKKATLAAKMYPNTIWKMPKFSINNEAWSDYNDLFAYEGKSVLIEQLLIDTSEFIKINCLGHNEGIYFFSSTENQQIVALPFNQLGQNGLRRLIAGDPFWYKNYGLPDEDGNYTKINWSGAVSNLMETCHKEGIFDPTKVRGIGVWSDGNKYCINDGTEVYNSYDNSVYHYQKTIKTDYSLQDPDSGHMLHLLEAFKNLEYKNPTDYFYLSSWYIQAQILSVMPWRFHIWLSGSAGTGKSTILKWLNSLTMNCVLTDNTSSAGVRQTIKNNSTAVIYDEAEPSTPRTKDVIELARQMSSNGEYKTLRGTTSGKAINHNTQCVLCFGSIQVEELSQADRSRIFTIELGSTKEQDEERFADISNRFNYFIMNKNKTFTHIYKNIDNILWNASFCKALLKKEKKIDSRLADQLSIAIACFYVYWGSSRMEKSDYEIIIKTFSLVDSEYTDQNQQKDSDGCYDAVMEIILDNYTQTTVAQAIHNIRYNDNLADHDKWEKMLGNHGLKYYKDEETLFIANKNHHLRDKIQDFKDITRILKRDSKILVNENLRQRITQLGYIRGIKIRVIL